jgi:hypothetical protein
MLHHHWTVIGQCHIQLLGTHIYPKANRVALIRSQDEVFSVKILYFDSHLLHWNNK